MTCVFAIVSDQDYNLCPFGLNVSWSLWEDIHHLISCAHIALPGGKKKKKQQFAQSLGFLIHEGDLQTPVCVCVCVRATHTAGMSLRSVLASLLVHSRQRPMV
ncbi:unnamed protein product [Boreogadus saida]